MTDFSHLNKLKIKEDVTISYPIYQLEGEPTLQLKSATQSNKSYFNGLLRASRNKFKAVRSKKIDAAMLDKNREEDVKLFSEHVVVGWENIRDSKGTNVEFNKQNCLDFLNSLVKYAPHIFDDIRNFATDIENFSPDAIDGEDVGKN